MGQYHKLVILDKNFKETLDKKSAQIVINPHHLLNGLKLMEFSYVGNSVMNYAENLLGGEYYGYPFVVCGDYAENIMTYFGEDSLYNLTIVTKGERVEDYVPYYMKPKVEEENPNISDSGYRYIVNLTKKEYVDLGALSADEDGFIIHPLSILCACSNGLGGGDYKGTEMDKVGIWAYDNIGMTNDIPEGFTELKVNFREE